MLKYEELPDVRDKAEVARILESGSRKALLELPLSVGINWPDWKRAQDVCLKLADHPDEAVRANACLGLAYVARTKGKLEKERVKPVLLRELRSQEENRERIIDAIEDINSFLDWRLAAKHLNNGA